MNSLIPEALTSTLKSAQVMGHYIDIYDRYKDSRNYQFDIEDYTLATVTDGTENPYFDKFTKDMFQEDSTLVKVIVYINDINDNPPVFTRKIFTGGVTTSAHFGSSFMQVLAIDKDDSNNGKVSYYQIGEIKRTLTEGLDNLQKAPFLVDAETGDVQLNFDPQKGMKGYFDFMVLANDTAGYQDVAHVFIYLLRDDQRVKFVLRQQPHEVREKINLFRE